MAESEVVGVFMLGACGVGGAVAWGACIYSNYLDRRDLQRARASRPRGLAQPKIGEAPVLLTAPAGIFGLIAIALILATVAPEAGPYLEPCSTIDPNESWAAWLAWVAAGCFWP